MNKDNVKRILNNLSRVPSYSAIINKEEVDYLLENHDTLIFCNGRCRRIIFDKITDNHFYIKSVEAI